MRRCALGQIGGLARLGEEELATLKGMLVQVTSVGVVDVPAMSHVRFRLPAGPRASER